MGMIPLRLPIFLLLFCCFVVLLCCCVVVLCAVLLIPRFACRSTEPFAAQRAWAKREREANFVLTGRQERPIRANFTKQAYTPPVLGQRCGFPRPGAGVEIGLPSAPRAARPFRFFLLFGPLSLCLPNGAASPFEPPAF